MNSTISKQLLLWLLAIIAIASVGLVPPIGQDPGYHHFADTDTWLGIPNSLNVLSNLPFLLVGVVGIVYVYNARQSLQHLYWSALTFCIGVALIALGSGYYHWYPTNSTLVWDRLPMTIGFMGLFAMVLSVFVSPQGGQRSLPLLVVVGVASVFWWFYTESSGQGDLRFYALVQFLPMLLTLVILVFFKTPGINKSKLVLVLLWYTLAKVLEFGDAFVLETFGIISGHSLKHVAAAVACYFVISWLKAVKKRDMDRSSPT